jgi:hypothetical protein
MEASPADWVTAAFTAVLAIVTLVLAVATSRYVTQTKRLVAETEQSRADAQAARALALQPDLRIDLTLITKMTAGVRLINVGQGPALDVQVTLTFEPRPGTDTVVDSRPWRTNVILAGEDHVFAPPMREQRVAASFETLAAGYHRLGMNGTMRDLLNRTHSIEAVVEDVPARQQEGADALHLYEENPVRRAGRQINHTLKAIDQALRSRAGRSDDEPERLSDLANEDT